MSILFFHGSNHLFVQERLKPTQHDGSTSHSPSLSSPAPESFLGDEIEDLSEDSDDEDEEDTILQDIQEQQPVIRKNDKTVTGTTN